jgi:hypothetical protein
MTLRANIVIMIFVSLQMISIAQERNAIEQGGKIIPPNIPFPESIFEGKSGEIYFMFYTNKAGKILSFGISRIMLWQVEGKKKSTGKLVTIYADKKINEREVDIKTKEGIKYFDKLKDWMQKFGEGTRFVQLEKTEIDNVKGYDSFPLLYKITFGKLWPEKDRHKFPVY